MGSPLERNRRKFLALAGVATAGFWIRRARAAEETKEKEKEISPAEDLMREHGVLKRVLLIYSLSKFTPKVERESAGS
jgi:hypothetical protein